jgi:protein-tyrosine phosphatase
MFEGKSILFVCYGNACRSPMAEGMAKKALGEKIAVESAGLAPSFDSATFEAVWTVRELYGVDISHHVPKNVVDMPLRDYDLIVVLDTYVYNTIKKLAEDLTDKLMLWDIQDPYGSELGVYHQVAETIWEKIQDCLL